MGRPKGGGGDAAERLRAAAGRGFRVGGFGGVGVDALAKEAGLTSGAFYAHFPSKAAAFRLALTDGLEAIRAIIAALRAAHGEAWLEPFVTAYLDERLAMPLSEACALPTLTADAARADEATRTAYAATLDGIIGELAAGLGGPEARVRAWRLLAGLAGAAAMARAVPDEAMRREILAAARGAALAV